MNRTLPIIAIAALAVSLSAQSSRVIPVGYAAKEGGRSRHVPLRYAPARIQCGYDAKATGWTKTQIIKELWVRPDQAAYLTTGFSVTMQVILSSNGADPRTTSLVYEENHGTDRKVFIKKRVFKFSPFKVGTTFPWKFNLQLKGDSPFIAFKKTFLVDWATYSTSNLSNTNFYVDSTVSTIATKTGNHGSFSTYGTSCNPTTMSAFARGLNAGETLRTYGYTGTAKDTVVSWLGASKTNIALTALKGCTLYTRPLYIFPGAVTAGTGGFVNFVWAEVPAALVGNKLWSQMAAFTPSFTKMRFSQGIEMSIGNGRSTPFLVSHRYNYGFGTGKFNPDTDKARFGWEGLAIIFDIK